MKKHWFIIKGTSLKIKNQWKQLAEYIEQYPASKITVYNSDNNIIDKYFCLECSQEYSTLDLEVNSLSTPLERLKRKPSNISENKVCFSKLLNIYGS